MADLRFHPRVGVVGCGAVGSFYGGKLCRAGCPTHFLLRSGHEVVFHRGVWIRSPAGDFGVRPVCAVHPEEIGPCDLVLIGLKTTANHRFVDLLPPLVGRDTVIVTLQNGLGNEESLSELFGPERILGGLCFVCLNRVQPGVIEHLAHGNIVLGEFQGGIKERTRALAALFGESGIACQLTEDLARAHWEKLVWNIPFNGLGVVGAAGYSAFERRSLTPGGSVGACLATDALLGDRRWEQLLRELMREVVRVAWALGHELSDQLPEEMIEKTRSMGSYKASTLLDFEAGRPLEMESLFLEPLRRAKRVGVEVPYLSTLCEILRQLDWSANAA